MVGDENKDVKKQDILFSKNWNFNNQEVIVVEGVLDLVPNRDPFI